MSCFQGQCKGTMVNLSFCIYVQPYHYVKQTYFPNIEQYMWTSHRGPALDWLSNRTTLQEANHGLRSAAVLRCAVTPGEQGAACILSTSEPV